MRTRTAARIPSGEKKPGRSSSRKIGSWIAAKRSDCCRCVTDAMHFILFVVLSCLLPSFSSMRICDVEHHKMCSSCHLPKSNKKLRIFPKLNWVENFVFSFLLSTQIKQQSINVACQWWLVSCSLHISMFIQTLRFCLRTSAHQQRINKRKSTQNPTHRE